VFAGEIDEVPSGVDVTEAGSMRLELSREFLTGGRSAARREVAAVEVMQDAARVYLAERQVHSRVDQLLVRVVGHAAIVQRLAAEDTLLTEAEEALRARFAVAEARYVDVLRLRTERLRVQADLAASQTESRVSRRALLGLAGTGDSVQAISQLADSILARPTSLMIDAGLPPAPSLDSLIAISGVARLTGTFLTRAEAEARLRRAELRPTLSAGVGVQRFGRDGGSHHVGPTLGFAVSLPFTSAGANRATRDAADLSVEAARRQQEATLAAVRAELAAARDRYEAAIERLAGFDAALLRGAREERESALSAYRTGELSLLELIDFERALTRTEIVRLRSRIEAADAYADLIAGASDDSTEPPATLTSSTGGAE
jgi:cobalt-zinc-cadmium efflux system outer membrane protein